MFNSYKILFEKKEIYYLLITLIGSVIASLLELIGIGTIPAFVLLITDMEKFFYYLEMYNFTQIVQLVNGFSFYELVLISAILLSLVFLLKNIFIIGLILFEGVVLRNLTTNLSRKLFNIYINSPTIFHAQRNSSNIIRNITEEIEYVRASIRASMVLVREALTISVIVFTVFIIDPIIATSIFLLLGTSSILFIFIIQNKLENWGKKHQDFRGKQIKSINHGLGSIKDIKILNREYNVFKIFLKETYGRMHYHFLQQFFAQIPRRILEVVSIISVLIIVLLFFYLNRSIEIMLPIITLFAVSVIRFVPSLNGITSSYTTIKFYRPAVMLVISELQNYSRYYKNKFKLRENVEIKNNLTSSNIYFKYPESSEFILKNINIKINRGEAVGIVGKTGSGKTTLVENIIGLLKPSKGEVKIDGMEYDLFNQRKLSLGYVPQDIFLTDDKILNNVAFGIEENLIDEKKVIECLKIANIYDFVQNLPNALNTFVGERGIKLSGGQKQRIGIARSLYDNPDLLVFDEGTSSLDNLTENEIINSILNLKGQKTIIIIAHRLTTIENCDNIFLLEKGVIKDQGKYTELIKKHELLSFVK